MSRRLLVLAAIACASCGVFRPSADDLRNDPHGHLVWATRKGDVAAIRALAATGMNLDASTSTPIKFVFPDFDHAGSTALTHAVRKHQPEAVRVLLEWGADPDATEPGGWPPLLIAATNNDRTIVKLLLDAGAELNQPRLTALIQAESGGPLWHLIEHVLERVHGDRSPTDALEFVRATAAQSQP